MSAHVEAEVVVRRRFTVAEYEQMGATGVLGPDDRVELLDGEIVVMSPIGPRHAGVVNRLTRLLITRLSDRAVVTVQNPMVLRPWSEPEPDVLVARPRADFYGSAHPEPDDVLLAIEVADTSLAKDRGIKLPLYAAAGVPEVWIVDLAADAVHRSRRPGSSGFADTVTLSARDRIVPTAFPDLDLAVGPDLLGLPEPS